MKILFRIAGGARASNELGTGHIFRAINLSKMLKNHEIMFAIQDYGGIKEICKKMQILNTKFLSINNSIKEDYEETLKIIIKNDIDIVIVDKINTKKSYLKKLQSKIFTVYITDLIDYEFPANLVINGFVGLKNEIIKNKFNSKCVLGPSHQILSNRYMRKSKFKKKYDLLITFGGYDANNLIEKLCDILPKFLPKLKVKIILGPITKKPVCLKLMENKFKSKLKVINYTNNLRKEILQSKFGLCSGGLTTYEFASSKVPFAIICQYSHQQLTAREWEKQGHAFNFGHNDKNLTIKIKNLLSNLIKNEIKLSIKDNVIDGFGVKRVADIILESYNKNQR